ncbi:hypothetical protein HKCCE4037_04915 [Rhodobacterales bacterium HKCCE4037]|nr:hypothetical protein [Rhodobacterales bacterium HKCCE4037]
MTILLTYGADFLVILASLGAMGYCIVLSRRLNRLTSFDKGLGGAIAVMSSQVDEMKAALHEAKAGSDGEGKQLSELVHQARDISTELEMMIAACHDFAEDALAIQDRTRPTPEPETALADGVEQPLPPTTAESDRPEAPFAEPEKTEITPIFGSRRAQSASGAAADNAPTALFRHRKPMAG